MAADAAAFRRDLARLEAAFQALQPECELTVRDPAMGVEGHVVVWNTGISKGGPLPGCGKGGTRITPTLSLDEVRMLARTMALKNAAAGLPLGGAKSGLKADPAAPDFEPVYRRFVKLCAPILHENGGPFGGFGFDIGGRPEHALWAIDELKTLRCFTGKPLDKGGTDYDREGIAGLGVATAAVAAAKALGLNVPGLTFAVQGIGAMGAAVIRYFAAHGARLTHVSDPRLGGSFHFPHGASEEIVNAIAHGDIAAANQLIPADGTLISTGFDAPLFALADVVFPCAVQNVITPENVASINARLVAEGANGPIALACYPLLAARGITVIPDFIANPGGIIAAFVELTSPVSVEENMTSRAKAEEAKALTIAKITQNVNDVMATSVRLGVTPREAGLDLAYRRILEN